MSYISHMIVIILIVFLCNFDILSELKPHNSILIVVQSKHCTLSSMYIYIGKTCFNLFNIPRVRDILFATSSM